MLPLEYTSPSPLVIRALIDQLAQGLQKWVGWQEGDTCCLKGKGGAESKGIGKTCECSSTGGGTGCCSGARGTTCHDCGKCGTVAKGAGTKCYLSAYCKPTSAPPPTGDYYWPTISTDSTKVHLLARIFLGSVCLIWSGLSQLGWLTKGGSGSGNETRWKEGMLSKEGDGLGSFMAAMGYNLERLNQGQGKYCLG
uniref:Variant erythrocyte surface antigen-1, beta subunit n=1 Tax=Babesia bovis TaxID=5865 RepID=A7ASP8_BABBO|eukprot:XP_001611135.1 variant erythrocyte surface antigen-1, beta subunit [Babesia bovis T2Bo]